MQQLFDCRHFGNFAADRYNVYIVSRCELPQGLNTGSEGFFDAGIDFFRVELQTVIAFDEVCVDPIIRQVIVELFDSRFVAATFLILRN